MRGNLKSGTFYGMVQKFGERAYKPWEEHELYQKFVEETKSKLTEEDFILRLAIRRVKTICIQDVIDKSTGRYLANHIWTDYDNDVWASSIGDNSPASLIGHVFEFDADVNHYLKTKDGSVTYDYTLSIKSVSDREVGKAYANALKIQDDRISVLENWFRENL